MFEMIFAAGLNGEIGVNGRLPFHVPEDLLFFQRMTTGKNVVIGRKTFDSLPSHVISSRDRRWYIISRKAPIYINFNSYIVAGGAEIYKLFEGYVDVVYKTVVHGHYPDSDTFYDVNKDIFKLVEVKAVQTSCNGVNFHFEKWVRKD